MSIALPAVTAQSASPDLVFGSSTFEGRQSWSGTTLGFRVTSATAMPGVQLTAFSPLLQVHAFNRSANVIAQGEVNPSDGGFDRTFTNGSLVGDYPRQGADLLIVPVAGAPPPTIRVSSASLATQKSDTQYVEETAYITSERQLLNAAVFSSLIGQGRLYSIRIEGTFAVALWQWNVTVDQTEIPTGSFDRNAQRAPVTGTEVSSQNFQQTIQAMFHDGWLEASSPAPLQATGFVDQVEIRGNGTAQVNNVVGNLAGGKSANGGNIHVDGNYHLTQAWTSGSSYLRFIAVNATSTLDGAPIELPLGPEDSRPGIIVSNPGDNDSDWMFVPWIAAIFVVAVVLHGPMQGLRYKGIQRRFEARDYIEVLTRIDPFTQRRRFRRTANLVKAVSLLSLEQYKEAGLFLGTLGPLDGPDPATQAFLRACASAGQALDADAIAHLTDCFRLDPSFRHEARTVPALRGYLPYFDVDSGGAA